jgi:2-haloacid dehalogenase
LPARPASFRERSYLCASVEPSDGLRRRRTVSTKGHQLAVPRKVNFVSLEVYGTLIDWETGIYRAFQQEAEKDGFTIERDVLIPLFMRVQREIMAGSYELYAEVLRRTAVRCASELGWELEPVRSSFLPNSIPSWPPFRDTNALLERLGKKFQIGLISNIDDKLLGSTRRQFRVDFDLVVTAQQVRSYKPDSAHFKEAQRRVGGKSNWVHIATSLYTDVEPCMKAKIPVIWINKKKEKIEGTRKPDAEVKDLRAAVTMLKA